ncbi:MAG: GAF domain-containing protein, partial [Deltaproteobacteria bacterium]|nr:GAF domain-containing protein [Deltaproteobacteria bacterium]
ERLFAEPQDVLATLGSAPFGEPGSGRSPLRRFRRRDGSSFLGEVSSAGFAVGERMMLTACVRDMTERVRAEEELLRYSRRLDVLRELDRAVLSVEQEPQHLAATALERLAELVAFDVAWVAWAREGDPRVLATRPDAVQALSLGQRFQTADLGARGASALQAIRTIADLGAEAPREPVAEALARAGMRSVAWAPLVRRGRVGGALGLGRADAGDFSPSDLAVAGDVASVLVLALENCRLLADARGKGQRLRELTEHLRRAEEVEREAISRELHDAVGQNLTALGLNLHVVAASLPPEAADRLGPRIDDSLTLLSETTRKVRNLMAELRPPVLADYGLRAAFR